MTNKLLFQILEVPPEHHSNSIRGDLSPYLVCDFMPLLLKFLHSNAVWGPEVVNLYV